jgi:ABC-type Na+ efflux pump permease subunit
MLAVLAVWVILPLLAAMVVGEDNAAYAFLRWLTPVWGVTYLVLEPQEGGLSVFKWVALLLPLPMLALVALQARRLTVVTRRVVAEIGDRNARA